MPRKAKIPTTSVMVVKITLPARAGSIFRRFMIIGKVAPERAAAIRFTIMAKAITTPSKFPQIRRDIAILVDDKISLQTLQATIRSAAGELLTDLWLFDVYQGDNVPAGQRSLAFALVWQDYSQTLSDDTVKTTTDKVVAALSEQHGAQLRDS